MCEPRLEQLQVSLDGGGERQSGQVRQVIRADRWSKSLVTDTLELVLVRLASVALQGDVPLLSRAAQVVGSEPDMICVQGLLGAEELLALVEPPERVYLAVKGGKGEFVVAWHGMALRSLWNMKVRRHTMHGGSRQGCGLGCVTTAVEDGGHRWHWGWRRGK